jgi:hypothetical protein
VSSTPEEGGLGRPFGDDYLGGAASELPGTRLRQRVHRQVSDLVQRRSDPVLRRQVVASLKTRRSRNALPDFDVLEDPEGRGDTFHIPGEIIVTRRTWDSPAASGYLSARGLVAADSLGCEDLEDRLVRLVLAPGRTAETQDLDDMVTELRLRGFAASLTHMAPLARPISKGLGGPALGPGLGSFEDYQAQDTFTAEGTGPRVAVIDTGITQQSRTDGWLESIPRTDETPGTHGGEGNIDPLDAVPVPDGYLDFAAGHGSFVAGVIQQVAPSAEIVVYRAVPSDGIGTELDVACAMVRAVRDGAKILNLSLGCQTRYDTPSLPIAAALEKIAEIEKTPGETLIIAAAGNYGDTRPCWPAAFRRVVSVGGLASDLHPTAWSSRGFWVDCATVGEGILSTFVQGEESYEFTADPDTFSADSFARWTGTSFAAPQVAGAVARLAHERGITPRQALAELLASGDPVPDFGQAFRILPGL